MAEKEQEKQTENNKPQKRKISPKVREMVEKFNDLTNREKIEFLTRCGVWHLKFKNKLVTPTREMRKIIYRLSRLMFICDNAFEMARSREIDFYRTPKLAELISIEKINKNVVQPVSSIINDYTNAINSEINNDKQNKQEEKNESNEN